MKMLQDIKSRGGFGLPNRELYYSAAILVWLKNWINLKNKRILAIEGHSLQRGWHAFLWDTGPSKQQYFHRHLIRDLLINNWIKVKKKHYVKIPVWLSTMEATTHPNNLDLNKMLKYKDLLDIHGNLKTIQDLQELGLRVDWWAYFQIQS
uniref:Uncharacterized protein n=1 Tax=Micrurus surinamensis TaxID=129470 RepID=A0A2D4PYK0_MICSU